MTLVGGVSVTGISAEGQAFMDGVSDDWVDLNPDLFIARIPMHLTIGIDDPRTSERYILRRPPLQ